MDKKIIGEGKIITKASRLGTHVPLYDITIRGISFQNLGRDEGGVDAALGLYSEPNDQAGFERSSFFGLTFIGFGIGISVSGVPHAAFSRPVYGPTGRNKISHCEIRDTLARTRIGSGGGHGIFVRGGYFHVTDNRIDNMQGGILGPTCGIVANNMIINAWEDNGIYVSGGVSVSVNSNYIENTNVDGIALSDAQRIAVVGNTIINARGGSIRLQQTTQATITGNTCRVNEESSHFIRGYASEEHEGTREAIISNNIFQGPTNQSSNPIAFASGRSPHRGIIIMGNIFYDLDTSSLESPFFGPYAIINIQRDLQGIGSEACSVIDNLFSHVVEVPGGQPPWCEAHRRFYIMRMFIDDEVGSFHISLGARIKLYS